MLSSPGVAGQQQPAPGPVDRPRGGDGAGGGAVWSRSARGVRGGEEQIKAFKFLPV